MAKNDLRKDKIFKKMKKCLGLIPARPIARPKHKTRVQAPELATVWDLGPKICQKQPKMTLIFTIFQKNFLKMNQILQGGTKFPKEEKKYM